MRKKRPGTWNRWWPLCVGRRRTIFHGGPWRIWGFVQGLESREPGRELEQQPEELPVGEPEQEHAGEPEQQPGVPPRLARRSGAWPKGRN